MEPGEALSTAAQIAVTLAGFAGVVVVFRRESVHEWSPADRFRLRALLTNSILPLVLCMIGVLLLTITPAPKGIWRWCSGFAFTVSLLFAIMMTKIFVRLDLPQIKHEPGNPVRFVSVRDSRERSDSVAVVQHGLPRRILAVLRRDCLPTRHRRVPVCAHDSSAAHIISARLRIQV